MSGWAPQAFLAPPRGAPREGWAWEVLSLWPPYSRNSSSRVAEASLRSCRGLGPARWRALSSTFPGGSRASRLAPWTWLQRVWHVCCVPR